MTDPPPSPPQPPSSDPWASRQQSSPPPGGNPYGAPPYGWGTPPPTGDPYAAPQYGPRPPANDGDPYGAPQYGPAPPPPYRPFPGPPQFDATWPPASPAPGGRLPVLAILSLVFGVVSIVGTLLVFFRVGGGYYIGSIAGIVGLTLGIVAQIRGRSGLSLAGLTVSAIALAVAILLLITSLVIHH